MLYRHHAEFVVGRAEVLTGDIKSGFEHIDHALHAEEEMLASDPEFAYASGVLDSSLDHGRLHGPRRRADHRAEASCI